LQDPAAPSLVAFGVLALVGFVVIVLGWHAAAGSRFVAEQVPVVVSGGAVGLAVVLVGAVLAAVQIGRRLAAAERVQAEQLIDEAARLLMALTADPEVAVTRRSPDSAAAGADA
jgi:hypothetical protein